MSLGIESFVGGVPMAILVAAIVFHRWQTKRNGIRSPSKEKLLRPAGFSLSCQLEDLWGDFSAWAMAATFLAMLSYVYAALLHSPVVSTLLFGLLSAICTVIAWRKFMQMRRVRLGFHGEQCMGEYLQALISEGYRVFHDIPGDGKWNVDHVAVGPAGVFVIETKTKYKKPSRNGQADHEVIFDGKAIRYPYFTDRASLQQARNNAAWVANWLSKATGESVSVQPIVALPGWMVKQTAPGTDVWVMNVKAVPKYIASSAQRLSKATIDKITYQLDQKCRDVEF